ncbi:MAG: CopD family protein [Psychroflexus sp.]|jgi:putative membrane protein|nr:CopD family protein [Psychroflexus sp.]MDR9449408.1 CopD family protein [Psychroflexus sp.]
MTYLYVKSLHLIFVITWFAGLFYIPRLFIYLIEANQKDEAASKVLVPQLQLMINRLWNIITWPSAILATGFAIWLLILNPSWLEVGWMHAKLGFVVLLILYHLKNHQLYLQSQKNQLKWSSNTMRIWNEGATIILFAVIFIIILRSAIDWIFGLLGLIGLAVLLMLGIKLYKKLRKKQS